MSSFFNKNSYILIKNFFTISEQNAIKHFRNNILNLPDTKGKHMKYYEYINNKKELSRIENFYKHDISIKNFVDKKITPVVSSVVNNEVVLFKDKINFKLSNGNSFSPYQDFYAWSDFNPPIYYTAALFPDNQTENNGCLQFVHDWNIQNKTILPDNILNSNSLNWIKIYPNTSDLLIFSSFVPHKTNKSRSTLYFTFNNFLYGNLLESYYKKKRLFFPPEIDKQKEYKFNEKYNWKNPIIIN